MGARNDVGLYVLILFAVSLTCLALLQRRLAPLWETTVPLFSHTQTPNAHTEAATNAATTKLTTDPAASHHDTTNPPTHSRQRSRRRDSPFFYPNRHPHRKSAYTCLEILAIDRDSLRDRANRSRNHLASHCDRRVLQLEGTGATTWRRATWSKVDVLQRFRNVVQQYDYAVVRDLDTKLNLTHALERLREHGGKGFVIGTIEYPTLVDTCDKLTAVTNWFAFRTDAKLVKHWFKSRRNQTDQHIFNLKFRPCCRDDVLCVDKCEEALSEIHCRSKGSQMTAHFGSQDGCIEQQTLPNREYYAPHGAYICPGERRKSTMPVEKDEVGV